MIRLIAALFVVCGVFAAVAAAQEPPLVEPESQFEVAPSLISPTPEMWFYQQELQRADDPKKIVQRNAQRRAAERRDRIAAMRWYGFSNQRPQAHPYPWAGTYSPTWSGDYHHSYRWVGGYQGTAVRVLNYRISRR